MIFPEFRSVRNEKVLSIGAFGGCNRTPSCEVGEFSEMKNLSSKNFPALSPISEMVRVANSVEDLFVYDGTIFKITLAGELYAGSKKLREGLDSGQREFSVLGKYLVIMPDGIFYHLESGEVGTLGSVWRGDGVFAKEIGGAEGVGLNTVRSVGVDFGRYFKCGDCLEISEGGNVYGFYVVSALGDGYITFENADLTEGSSVRSLVLERKIPSLKHTFECNNRIWGIEGDVIFASALGDPFNFYKYRGISTDSYFKEVYSGGNFTAGAAYGETPMFFKENSIYRVFGTSPDNFYVDVKEAPGVSEACGGSVAVLDGGVYYAGTDGIYLYTSAYPVKISDKLGSLKIGYAVGGADGKKYYISFSEFYGVKQSIGDLMRDYYQVQLYAYDTEKSCWYKYDDALRVKKIVTGPYGSLFKKSNTLALDMEGGVFTLSDKLASTVAEELLEYPPPPVESFGVTGVVDTGTVSRMTRLRFSALVSEGAELYGDVSFDGGEFLRCFLIKGEGREKKYSFRVPRKRFSSCRIRLGGSGDYTVYGMQIYYIPAVSGEL